MKITDKKRLDFIEKNKISITPIYFICNLVFETIKDNRVISARKTVREAIDEAIKEAKEREDEKEK